MYSRLFVCVMCLLASGASRAQEAVFDIPTRAGVTQRLLLIPAAEPKAAVVLFAGGHGGLQLTEDGRPRWGNNNFLVRSARLFADQGLTVVVIDAPSDHLSPPYLSDFRQSPEHAADVRAVIAWLKERAHVPVWLVGTSRGTQSVAAVSTSLSPKDGPDGIVLTSTILADRRSRPVPDMPLEKLAIPVLVVHHEQDGCRACPYSDIPRLMKKLAPVPRKELIAFQGGENIGDPCEALAYHGYNAIESQVVNRIASWIVQ